MGSFFIVKPPPATGEGSSRGEFLVTLCRNGFVSCGSFVLLLLALEALAPISGLSVSVEPEFVLLSNNLLLVAEVGVDGAALSVFVPCAIGEAEEDLRVDIVRICSFNWCVVFFQVIGL